LKLSHFDGYVAVRSPTGDFGKNIWEWLGIWLLGFPAAQTSNPLGALLVIEHNLDVIRCSDWMIDLAPEGGDMGGQIVVTGTPEEVAAHSTSDTAHYFRQVSVSSLKHVHRTILFDDISI